jgi:ribosome-associated toxin RatA of RatAB toxin-antitoxin module
MPEHRRMRTVDALVVRAPLATIFSLAADVESWPRHLAHYRHVTFRDRRHDSGGVVDMSANRPFGAVNWPTWWRSEMQIDAAAPAIRFRHIGGVTTGMDVVWEFHQIAEGTHVRIVHLWDGPPLPLLGPLVAMVVIGPVFVHGIASRTLAGLARVAELSSTR